MPDATLWLMDDVEANSSGSHVSALQWDEARRAEGQPGRLAEGISGVSPQPDVDLLRPGVCGVGGVYRPRQFRDQHPGRYAVRLPAALGAAVVERDGDPDPVSFGQARHCDRADAAAELPQALLAGDDAGALGRGRDRCHLRPIWPSSWAPRSGSTCCLGRCFTRTAGQPRRRCCWRRWSRRCSCLRSWRSTWPGTCGLSAESSDWWR